MMGMLGFPGRSEPKHGEILWIGNNPRTHGIQINVRGHRQERIIPLAFTGPVGLDHDALERNFSSPPRAI
jgi:hypothetical protein